LTTDTARVVDEHALSTLGLADLGGVIDLCQTLISVLVLAATSVWGLVEHRIYQYDLARRGSQEQITMP
jgi:hypothetical protein